MNENKFIKIVAIFFEAIPNKEESFNFLDKIINMLKKERVNELADYINNNLIKGI